MRVRDDGGSAFPNDGRWANDVAEGGMSLLDYFAAAALHGLCVNETYTVGMDQPFRFTQIARRAYQYADAMLAERAERSK